MTTFQRDVAGVGHSMLSSKVIKQKSTIHGHGLFAKETIKKDEIVCFDANDMKTITLQEFEILSPHEKQEWNKHGFYDTRDGLIKCETDDGIYINHGENPNVIDIGDTMIASTDIKIGEELTVDYRPYYLPDEEMPDFIAPSIQIRKKPY